MKLVFPVAVFCCQSGRQIQQRAGNPARKTTSAKSNLRLFEEGTLSRRTSRFPMSPHLNTRGISPQDGAIPPPPPRKGGDKILRNRKFRAFSENLFLVRHNLYISQKAVWQLHETLRQGLDCFTQILRKKVDFPTFFVIQPVYQELF